jgi:hypothetical protein
MAQSVDLFICVHHERGTEETGAEGFAPAGEGAKKGKSGAKYLK